MMSMRALVVGLMFAAGLMLGVACGGGSTTPAATPTIDSGSAAPTTHSRDVTPFPTPLVSGNKISSATKGYTATMPDGWHLRANLIQTADASVDVLFEQLKPNAKVQASISLDCIVIKADSEAGRQEFLKTNTARQGLNKNITESKRTVAGMDATVLAYRSESQQGSPPVDKEDIFFATPNCDWILTTTAAAGERGAYAATFDAFLSSFQVQ